MIHFEIPKNQSSIIKVIGVGGGGSNAVNYMHSLGIEGVDFVVCNTDSQALALSPIPNKIQLGPHLTQGLGAGANPEIGKQAGEESMEDITKILKVNTRMAFITAGMGGGTGTGGAPVVAQICRELGILTVGIVTTPFSYEGRKRMAQAQAGIDRLRDHVDTILIISNDKLRQQFGNLPFTQAFAKADDVLATAAKCITDVITTTGQINVDFADVCTVMKSGGVAILGSATVAGDNRALHAVEEALSSPLLNDNDIRGAKWILLNITSAAGDHEHTMDEAEAIQAFVQKQAGDGCDVILGMGHDPNLDDNIAVTIIATGFNHKEISGDVEFPREQEDKIVLTLDGSPKVENVSSEEKDEPAVSMDPVLVEAKEMKKPLAINPTPAFPKREEKNDVDVEEEERVNFTLQTEEEIANINLQQKQEEAEKEEQVEIEAVDENSTTIELVIKNEEDQTPQKKEIESNTRRELSEAEREEKETFEAQKRALEERAERLRKMSFNIDSVETGDDIEAVPAYVRRNVEIDNSVASSETFLSGYSVTGDNDKNNDKGDIGTINTFLDGKRPD